MKLILANQWIVNIRIKSECINKYIYIYMCVCVFMYIYTYIHICICTHILEKEMSTHSSGLEIAMDRGPWQAKVHGVAKIWPGLST